MAHATMTPDTTEPTVSPKPVRRESQLNRSIHGLRGFAAGIVVLFHIHLMAQEKGFVPKVTGSGPVDRLLNDLGTFGVAVFFCISGFLIVQSLIKHADAGVFAKNRAIRIYPVFALLHLIMFTVGVAVNYEWMGKLKHDPVAYAGHFFSNLFFLPGVNLDLPIAQKNAWSLSFEALFYVLAAVAFIATTNWQKNKAVSVILFATFAVATGLFLFFRGYSLFFLVGVASYFIWTKTQWKPDKILATLVGLAAFLIAAFSFGYRYGFALPFALLFFYTIVAEQGVLAKILQSRLFLFLGTISYSMYLIHPFVMDPLRSIAGKLEPKVGPTGALVFFVIATLTLVPLVSWVSYQLLEVRMTKWISKRLKKPAPAQPQAA